MSTIFKVAAATQEFRRANVCNQMAELKVSHAAGRMTGDGTDAMANALFNRSWIQLILTTSAGAAAMGLPLANAGGFDALASVCNAWSHAGKPISDLYGSYNESWKIQAEYQVRTNERDCTHSDQQFARKQQELEEMRSASDRAIESLAQAFKR